MLKSPLGRFRTIAFFEGCSFLCFAITMPLKYWLSIPHPNYIIGMIQGFLFIIYIALLIWVAYIDKWPFVKILLAFIASLIPLGTFYADKKWFRPQSDNS